MVSFFIVLPLSPARQGMFFSFSYTTALFPSLQGPIGFPGPWGRRMITGFCRLILPIVGRIKPHENNKLPASPSCAERRCRLVRFLISALPLSSFCGLPKGLQESLRPRLSAFHGRTPSLFVHNHQSKDAGTAVTARIGGAASGKVQGAGLRCRAGAEGSYYTAGNRIRVFACRDGVSRLT